MNEAAVDGGDEILESFERFMRQECGLGASDPLPYEHPYVSASWPVWETAWHLARQTTRERGSRWRHLKTGGHYELIARGLSETDRTPIVVYRDLQSGQVWVRPAAEFDDGRFAALDLPTL